MLGGGKDTLAKAKRDENLSYPRIQELARNASIISESPPSKGTNLGDSTAEFLVKRFSDVGNTVVVTAVSRDRALCRLALQQGRIVVALEPNTTKYDGESDSLDEMTATVAKSGMWARMLNSSKPVVTVGPGLLPVLVSSSNTHESTTKELEGAAMHYHGYPADVKFPNELKVASITADMHDLEIRESACHGRGLFAKKELSKESFIAVPLAGKFEVHDRDEDCLELAQREGVPRFRVFENMAPFLSNSEVARPTSALYLVPDRTCPLFYLNSSHGNEGRENFKAHPILKPSRDFKGDITAFLRNASHSVCFNVDHTVPKDTELLASYDFGVDENARSNEESAGGADEDNVYCSVYITSAEM